MRCCWRCLPGVHWYDCISIFHFGFMKRRNVLNEFSPFSGVRDIDYRKMQSNNPHTLSWAIANCNNSVHCLGLVYSEAIWSLYTQKLPQLYGYDANTSLEIVTRLTYIAAGHVSTWYSYDPPFGGCNGGSGYMKYLIAGKNHKHMRQKSRIARSNIEHP